MRPFPRRLNAALDIAYAFLRVNGRRRAGEVVSTSQSVAALQITLHDASRLLKRGQMARRRAEERNVSQANAAERESYASHEFVVRPRPLIGTLDICDSKCFGGSMAGTTLAHAHNGLVSVRGRNSLSPALTCLAVMGDASRWRRGRGARPPRSHYVTGLRPARL